MAIELSTAGIKVKYALESSANTRPTSGYTQIPGVKAISEFNPEPAQLEVTDLSDTEWKRYIPGLKDPGSVQSLTVNDYADFRTAWASMLSAYASAVSGGKGLWVEYAIPNHDSYFYRGVPSDLGFNGAEVDSVLENIAYFTPNSAPVWATASTT